MRIINEMNEIICSNNSELKAYVVAFCIGLILFLCGLFYFILKKGRRDSHYVVATALEFTACWVLFIPEQVNREIAEHNFWAWIEGFMVALIKSLNMLFQNDYDRTVLEQYESFSIGYNILKISVNVAMLMFAGAFILSFINGPLQKFKLKFFNFRDFYVFSVCNEKTITIAKSIPKNIRKNKIVFACDASSVEPSLLEEVDLIGGVCVNYSVSNVVSKKVSTCSEMQVFLFDDDEEGNLIELDEICETLKKRKVRNKIKIYTELVRTSWDMYDNYVKKHGLDGGKVIINFVRIEESFAYNNLLKHSIFDKTISDGNINEIGAVIVGGMNQRNMEMFKALLHLSQMPGYFLNLTVIDDKFSRKIINQMMPEIGEDGPGDGDAVYHIDYMEGTDFATEDLEDIITKICPKMTYVFINTGNDIQSITLAIRIKAAALRSGRSVEEYKLFVNVHNEEIWVERNDTLCKGIIPVGSLGENFDYNSVTLSNIEKISKDIHEARYPDKQKKPWTNYLNNEYNRHSVYARTLSFIFKIRILGENYHFAGKAESPEWYTKDDLEEIWNSMSEEEKLWKKYEHMRWNMYTRTLGYRLDSKRVLAPYIEKERDYIYKINLLKKEKKTCGNDEVRKGEIEKKIEPIQKEKDDNWKIVKDIRTTYMIHNDLIPFDELSLEDRIKDSLELPDNVVEVLRKA